MPWVCERVAGVTITRPEDWELLVRPKADAPLWAKLWPSAVALAEHLRGLDLAGRRVAELGAGLALPSVVAQARGAAVVAFDGVEDAVAAARGNGVPAQRHVFGDPLPGGPYDLVVAADVLHRAQNVEPLLATVRSAAAEVLLADPGRRALDAFAAAAADDGRFAVARQALPDGTVLLTLRRAAA